MDEYSRGVDPEIKIYFKKIIKSFAVLLLWLLGIGTAGFLFKLAVVKNGWHWYNAVYYFIAVVSFLWLVVFLNRLWQKN